MADPIDYNKKPIDYDKKIDAAQTMQLIGGILGGVGNLANSLNEVYQLSKGRQAAPIGNLGIALGQSLGGFGEMKMGQHQRDYAADTVSKMPGLDETSRNLALAGIRGGDVKSGMKAATDAIKNSKTGAIKEYEYGKVDPAFTAFMLNRRKAGASGGGGGGGNSDEMNKYQWYIMQNRLKYLDGQLDNFVNRAMLNNNPQLLKQLEDERNSIRDSVGYRDIVGSHTADPTIPLPAATTPPPDNKLKSKTKKVLTLDDIE